MTKLKKLNLVLGQLQAITLDGLDTLAKVTDSVEEGSDIDATVNLEAGYADTIEKLQAAFPSLRINVGKNYIRFETEMTKAWILTKLGDGTGVTADEAAAYIFPSKTFYRTNPVDKFNELRYFTAWGATINGNPSAWQYAFENAYALEELTLPDTLYDIPTYFFNNCTALKHVGGLEHVSKVRTLSFVGTKLEGELNLPLLDTLQDGAFYGTKITKVVNLGSIPSVADSNTSTSRGIFANCSELTDVILPNTVTFIGNIAFYNSSKLSEINFADVAAQITKIGERAFYNTKVHFELDCPNLETLGYASFWSTKITSIKNLGTISSLAAASNDNNGMFQNCTELLDVRLPYLLLTIGARAFKGCSKLQTVTGGARVTSIGDHAFYNCSSISTCTVDFTQVTTIGGSAFYSAFADGNNVELAFPRLTSLASNVFRYSKVKKITSMGNTLTELSSSNSNPQFGNSAIESIVFPTSLVTVSEAAFINCSKLAHVEMPETVQTIAWRAFSGCTKLEGEFYLPNCTLINDGAFKSVGAISITKLGSGCAIKSSNSDGAFMGSKITYINLEGVVEVGTSAFRAVTTLTSVGDMSSVTTLGQRAFYSASNLGGVVHLPSLTSISAGVFSSTSIKGVTSMGQITALVGTNSESQGTFQGCRNLKYVILPETLISMGVYEFYNTTSMLALVIKAQVPPTIASSTFTGLGAQCTIFVPLASLDAYKTAGNWTTYASRVKGYVEVETFPSPSDASTELGYLTADEFYYYANSAWQIIDLESGATATLNETWLENVETSDVMAYDSLTSDGSAYILTDITPNATHSYDVALKRLSATDTVLGSINGWGSNFTIQYYNQERYKLLLFVNASSGKSLPANVVQVGKELSLHITPSVTEYRTERQTAELASSAYGTATAAQSVPIALFAANNAGTIGSISQVELHSFTVYDDSGVKYADLIPAAFGRYVGMYDKIGRKFYFNASDTGSFTVSNNE